MGNWINWHAFHCCVPAGDEARKSGIQEAAFQLLRFIIDNTMAFNSSPGVQATLLL